MLGRWPQFALLGPFSAVSTEPNGYPGIKDQLSSRQVLHVDAGSEYGPPPAGSAVMQRACAEHPCGFPNDLVAGREISKFMAAVCRRRPAHARPRNQFVSGGPQM